MPDNPEGPVGPENEKKAADEGKPAPEKPKQPDWDEEETRPLDVNTEDEESIETAKIEDLSEEVHVDSPTEPMSALDPFAVQNFDIIEPPEEEEEDTGFAKIPPGPTEEVDYDEPRQRRPRRGRQQRREPRRVEKPAPVAAASKPHGASRLVIAAIVIMVIVLLALILWMAGRSENPAPLPAGNQTTPATPGP